MIDEMNLTQLREKLHEYVDTADEKVLRVLNTMVQEMSKIQQEYKEMTDDAMKVLDDRMAKNLNFPDAGAGWDAIKARLQANM